MIQIVNKYLKKRSKSKATVNHEPNNDDINIETKPKTILDELKLSDKLVSQLDGLKQELSGYKEQIFSK